MKTRQLNIKNKSFAHDCVYTNIRLIRVSSPTAAPAVFANASYPAVRASTPSHSNPLCSHRLAPDGQTLHYNQPSCTSRF
jgi:hypothetical protein